MNVKVACLALLSAVVLGGPPSAAASINCGRAVKPSEKAICASPSLKALDAQMSSSYAKLMKALGPTAQADSIRFEQTWWIGQRNNCGAKVACLRNAYQTRIGELEGYRKTAAMQ